MKDKHLYQRRTDGDYKGYTEESFYFNSTENLWCWKQTSTGNIYKAITIEKLRELKSKHKVGSGNYEHEKDTSLPEGFIGTDEFVKLIEIESMSREYIGRLLKRASTSSEGYDKRGLDRRKRGIKFVNCLKKSGIEYDKILHKSKYFKRKVWIFKKVNEEKIKKFKEFWLNKD